MPIPSTLLAQAVPPPALPAGFAWAVAFVFGLNVGSFLNVVAFRLPLGLSVVRPRSRCPACRTPIRAGDNLPVLSWILLGGRCRGCKGRISARYPLVELATGLLAVIVVHLLVVAPDRAAEPLVWAHAAVVFLVTAALLAASLVDADRQILPDEITLGWMWPAPVVAAVLPELVLGRSLDVPAWFPEFAADWPLRLVAATQSSVGIAVGAGIVWGIRALGSAWLGREAMGFGDVKLLGMIGGWTGPAGAVLSLVLGSVVGALLGVSRKLLSRAKDAARHDVIPFGPFLALGGFVALVRGHELLAWYAEQITHR